MTKNMNQINADKINAQMKRLETYIIIYNIF